MSNKPKQDQQRRRDEETRLSASHLALAQPTTVQERDEDDDEDWGDVSPKAGAPKVSLPTPAATVAAKPTTDLDRALDDEDDEDEDLDDEDLEQELSGSSNEEDKPVNQTREVQTARVQERVETPAPSVDEATLFQQIDQMQSNLPTLVKVLERKLEGINEQRRKLDDEERGVKTRINFLRAMSGQAPLPLDEDDEDEESAPRRRGGRRKASAEGGPAAATATATAPKTEKGEEAAGEEAAGEERPRGRGGRGKRHHNDQTLKQAICKALLQMTHPTSGKPYTGFVNDITTKVTLPVEKGGFGYKSTSAKPTNTVRIQMYRLEEDGKVIQNDDNSYTLRKRVVREMTGEEPKGE